MRAGRPGVPDHTSGSREQHGIATTGAVAAQSPPEQRVSELVGESAAPTAQRWSANIELRAGPTAPSVELLPSGVRDRLGEAAQYSLNEIKYVVRCVVGGAFQ